VKEAERRIFITEKAPVIRNALCTLLTGATSESDTIPGTRERLEAFAKEGCDRLVLDLRTVKESSGCMSPGVRNVRASQIGTVLVVTGEVTSPEILQEIEELRHSHSFAKHLTSDLRAFVHLLF
jgi:DNA-binding response OmpR family regulator